MRTPLTRSGMRTRRCFRALLASVVAATLFSAAPTSAAEPGNADRLTAPLDIWRTAAQTVFDDPRGIVLEHSTRFRGTVSLPPSATAGHVGQYPLKGINWLVSLTNQPEDIYITGEGTYQVTSSVGMLQVIGHRMAIDVKWGEQGPTRRFDSGIVPRAMEVGGAPIDIVLYEVLPSPVPPGNAPDPARASLRLALAPVPLQQVIHYRLSEPHSDFLFGCFNLCRCAVFSQPMGGDFDLVPLTGGPMGSPRDDGTLEWAMVNIRTVTPPTRSPELNPRLVRMFRGEGIYQWSPVTVPTNDATPTQRLRARITDSQRTRTPPPDRFDSGTVAVTVPWPKLQVSIADNHFDCFNRVLTLAAKPQYIWGGVILPAPAPIPHPWSPPAPEDR